MEGRSDGLTDDSRLTLAMMDEGGPVSVVSLREAGVGAPAQAIYALELAGWPVRRTGGTWRLADPAEPPVPVPPPTPRVRRVERDA